MTSADDELAALLTEVGEVFDADLHTKREVAKREEEGRQAFLLAFNAFEKTSILPVFEMVADRSTTAFRLRVTPGRGNGVTELVVTAVRGLKESESITARLRYRVNLSLETVSLEAQFCEGGLIDHADVPPEERSIDGVKKRLAAFIKRFKSEA
ncbi:MAG: hypothetical protein ACJ76Y_30470 [Thermoanaerobaculia bacterium]